LAPSGRAIPGFQATVLADALTVHVRRHLGATAELAGSVRSMDEWVESVDIVAGTDDVETGRRFFEGTAIARLAGHGPLGELVLRTHDDVEARIHLVRPSQVGRRLLVATGPDWHAGALLADVNGSELSEAEIYRRNGRLWVPPAARALDPEIAESVVRTGQIKGDLHLHTDRSPDGRMSLFEILAEAVEREYEYVLITDHTTGLRFGGLGNRPAIDLDLEAVIAGAVENRVALEVNGHRDRLDLSAEHAALAVAGGAVLAANSDAHRIGEMSNIANSVATMQRAGIAPSSVVNAMSIEAFREWAGVIG
jgi:hypothetical protein